MGGFVTHLSCPGCGRTWDHRAPRNLCQCGSPLLVEYDLEGVAAAVTKAAVRERRPDMWRYRELLPLEDASRVVSLGEGGSPLLALDGLGRALGVRGLWLKDDGRNPTGTFKARGAACGVMRARELGIRDVALASAGNAGAAWACYGAAAGIRVHVAMPKEAPRVPRHECLLYGAELTLVDGLLSDAGRVVAGWVEEHGWFDASTLREPYRLDGKKTLGFEIAEGLGWRLPDAIAFPTGGGVGVLGIWRGLGQLREMGWVMGGLPRLIVVQAAGCAPLVRAFETGEDESQHWPDARTLASGLRVPKPLGDAMVLRAIRESGGTAVAVSDGHILTAVRGLARAGILAGPEGAAALAGLEAVRDRGDLGAEERVVLVNTGTGLKEPEALESALRTPWEGEA